MSRVQIPSYVHVLLSFLMSKTILPQTSLLLARQTGLGLKLAGRTPACILLLGHHNNILHCTKSCIVSADIFALRSSTCLRLNIQQKRESPQLARKVLAGRQTDSRQRPASHHHRRHWDKTKIDTSKDGNIEWWTDRQFLSVYSAQCLQPSLSQDGGSNPWSYCTKNSNGPQ